MERNKEKANMCLSVYSYHTYAVKGIIIVLEVKLHLIWSDPIWSPQLSMNPVPISCLKMKKHRFLTYAVQSR